MNGIRFYEDFESKHDKRHNISHGSVIAAIIENGIHWSQTYDENGKVKPLACYECISAVFFHPNSDVCGTSVALDYLSECCKRISEKRAREIHPNLFVYLDDPIE